MIGEDGTILVLSDGEGLFALNPTGTLKWRWLGFESGVTFVSPNLAPDGTVLVTSTKGTVYAIDSEIHGLQENAAWSRYRANYRNSGEGWR